jgi:hypothetical protein
MGWVDRAVISGGGLISGSDQSLLGAGCEFRKVHRHISGVSPV